MKTLDALEILSVIIGIGFILSALISILFFRWADKYLTKSKEEEDDALCNNS